VSYLVSALLISEPFLCVHVPLKIGKSFLMSVRLSSRPFACNNFASAWWMFVKFVVWYFG